MVYALLNAMNTQNTVRIRYSINKKNLVPYFDSGSTHNFISEKTYYEIKLVVTPTTLFQSESGEWIFIDLPKLI